MKSIKKTQELYGLVLEADQNHIPALNQIGMCSFKQGRYMEARKKFTTILERTNETQEQADAWLNIACCYRFEKNWDQAEQSLGEARKLAPHDTSIDEESEKLRLAKSQTLLTETNQAFLVLKQIIISLHPRIQIACNSIRISPLDAAERGSEIYMYQ